MKVTFTITDETVVVSNTVKVNVNISGQVGEDNRQQHEGRARAIAEAFIPGADWAYSNFAYGANGLTFSVNSHCRIDNDKNQDLHAKAQEVSDRKTTLTVQHIDPSVPARELQEGESKLRKRMLERARDAATALGGFKVSEIDFTEQQRGGSKGMFAASATYSLDSAESSPLGHSEKIALSAEVVVVGEE